MFSEKNKAGFIALAVIGALLIFTYLLPGVFEFIRQMIYIMAALFGLFLLWKLLAQVENLSTELSKVNKNLLERSNSRQPACKSCGKHLAADVNFCPDCGADQRAETVESH